jgi:putative FmdB family regulatory protein
MPLFEFVCTDCRRPFEELVRSTSAVDGVKCPACGGQKIAKKISTFASKGTGAGLLSFGASSAASCSTST